MDILRSVHALLDFKFLEYIITVIKPKPNRHAALLLKASQKVDQNNANSVCALGIGERGMGGVVYSLFI